MYPSQIYRKNGYDSANWFSKVTYLWIWNFFVRNYKKKKLRVSDLEQCSKHDRSQLLGQRLENNWSRELNKPHPNLLNAIHRTFGWEYFCHGLSLVFSQCVLLILQAVLMGWLVKELAKVDIERSKEKEAVNEETIEKLYINIYLNGAGVVVLQGIITFFIHPYFFYAMKIGMDIRIACCHLIFKKALKLSRSSLTQTTTGQIVNFLSNDVNRFDWLLVYPHYFFIGPLMTIIITLILYYMEGFGDECLPGIFILFLYIPFQAVLGKLFTNLREKTATLTDERVRITNEFVRAIKVIKMYAWEDPFCSLINSAREKEVHMIKKASYLRGLNLGLFFVATKIIMFVMLFLYVASGKQLNSASVFVAMSLVNQLRSAVCLFVPYAVSTGAECFISVRRIRHFLLMDEFKELEILPPSPTGEVIIMKDVKARYSHSQDDVLSGISMTASPGELITVIGPVGSGKSSVLATLLGELPVTSGILRVGGRVSYASQEAWIVPGTIRDNIIFGERYDSDRYGTVVSVSALKRDFDLLPNGDKTYVGDVSGLSGGQRARVNLARALYLNAEIYLLDDPLSAVDAHVAKHIFDEAIQGFLKGKVVVLVTHQLQFIKSADKILLLSQGKLQMCGTYADLLNRGFDFVKFNPVNEILPSQQEMNHEPITIQVSAASSINPVEATDCPPSPIPNFFPPDSPPESFTRARPTTLSRKYSRASMMSRASVRSNKSVISVASLSRKEPITRTSSFRGVVMPISPHDIAIPVSVTNEKLAVLSNVEEGRDAFDVTDLIGEEGAGDEDVPGGGVEESAEASGKAYWVYVSAAGGCSALFLFILAMTSTQVLFTFSDWWLSVWTDYVEHTQNSTNVTLEVWKNPVLGWDTYSNVNIYTAQTVIIIFLAIARTIIFFILCMRASVKLHDRLFRCLVRAPMVFFDTNPVGILLNRCSRDMGIIDDILPPTFFDALSILGVDIGVAIMIIVIDPWVMLPTFLVVIVSYFIRKLYVDTARGIKRLEGITRSPVFTHLATSLNGLSTIRAFRNQKRFANQFDHLQDNHTAAWFQFMAASRWFGVTLDWMCFVYILGIMISMLSQSEKGSDVGLVITSAILLQTGYQWAIRQMTEVETQMTSVERVDEFAHLESEGHLTSLEPPPDSWPDRGEIEFSGVCVSYNPGDGNVLQDLNFTIKAKEKIGIVGRTGAGKSSIVNALFRLIKVSGSIIIDGIDIEKIGLHELRKKISIIPQEPVIFSGTIRRNLDPFDETTDGKLWKALDEVQLRETVQDISKGLEAFTSEEKNHFSVGQRQLLCLARAILRQNKILILDEATANVDPKTDSLIQQTIRTSFKDCTVITIAHRLDTIIDSDRILVLDAGQVVEFDEPLNLLKDENSLFSAMVRATGKDVAMKLRLTAQRAHDAHHLAKKNNSH